MKILLTGLLPFSIKDIGARLVKDGHHVSVLGRVHAPQALKAAGITVHDSPPEYEDPLRLMEASRYQVAVFFYLFQSDGSGEQDAQMGARLDALYAVQRAAKRTGLEYMVLVTDRRVFGRRQAGFEDETPTPDTVAGIFIKAAEDSLRCFVDECVQTLIVRVSDLYAPGDPESFFSRARALRDSRRPLRLDGTPKTLCDHLHVDDLALFLCRAVDARLTGTVHLTHGTRRTYGDVVRMLRKHLPGLKVSYTKDASRCATLESGSGARMADWVPRHDYAAEMAELLRPVAARGTESHLARAVKRIRDRLGKALPWVELALMGLAAWALNSAATGNAALRVVDFWFLFVGLTASIHGGGLGIAAAIIACAAFAVDWVQSGDELYILLYNTDNWLAPMSYLLAGALFGFARDAQREKLETAEREKRAMEAETQVTRTLYAQVSEDRDRLLEQIMRYRDSYGRIYRITRELDAVEPMQVFMSTVDVVEETMQNRSVAIYSRKGAHPFARLMVHSRDFSPPGRSLDMLNLPRLKESLDQGRLFVNTALEPGYPAFAAPVNDEGTPLAVIALWDVPFDKIGLYYENLFSVVAGLVQSAMVRAIRYFNLSGDMYLENTHILTSNAFRSTLDVYENMRKQRTGKYLLMRIESGRALDPEELDRRIGRITRSTDILGQMEDGAFYALFPQAEEEEVPLITARFEAQGLRCEVVSQEVAYA